MYRISPERIEEERNSELEIARGAYHDRQLFELIQNATDALVEAGVRGRVEVVLTEKALYCANEGAPLSTDGVTALLHSYMSRKSGAQIGHFGVGFKSVLAVTDEPRFYSRSGSFGFDRARSERLVAAVAPAAGHVAVLRLPHALDPAADAAEDSDLGALMEWATTVVKLPYRASSQDLLVGELARFPPTFLLFINAVETLRIKDALNGTARTITSRAVGDGFFELHDGDDVSLWRLFSTTVAVSEQAQADLPQSRAGDPAASLVPMTWAVPLDGRNERGAFWSFFPTNEESGLRGILHAGWKTTNDRHSLLESALTTELLEAFAKLAADSLPELFTREAPAVHIDLLPPRDVTGPFNRFLSDSLYPLLREREVVPDARLLLRQARGLKLPPERLPPEVHELWEAAEPVPSGWVHHAANTTTRRARIRELGAGEGSVREWLESMISDAPTVANCCRALSVAALLAESPQWRAEVAVAEFILTSEGTVVAPNPEVVFLSAPVDDDGSAIVVVHPAVVADDDARQHLERLGLRDLDSAAQMRRAADAEDWPRYWDAVRRATEGAAARSIGTLARSGRLRVRTRAGRFRTVAEVLLPGTIVPGAGGEAAAVCLDDDYHQGEMQLLRSEGGMASGPRKGGAARTEPWWEAAEEAVRDAYITDISARPFYDRDGRLTYRTPQKGPVIVLTAEVSGPLQIIQILPDSARAAYTEELLPLASQDGDWVATHRSKRINGYPDLNVESPSRSHARLYGYLNTSVGPVPVSSALGSEFRDWADVFPVAQFSADLYPFLQLPRSLVGDTRRWSSAFGRSHTIEPFSRLVELYLLAARSRVMPSLVRCRIGEHVDSAPPAEVVVTHDDRLFEALTRGGEPALLTPNEEATELLVEQWQMRRAEPAAFVGRFVASAEPTAVGDLFPRLARFAVTVVPCSDVWCERATADGLEREERQYVYSGGTLHYLDTLGEAELTEILEREVQIEAAQEEASQEKVAAPARISETAAAPTVEQKLALLLGAERLKRRIPLPVLAAIQMPDSALDLDMAAVAHALYGTAVLSEYREELELLGLEPPVQWAGRAREIEFVRRLGFDDAYAGARSSDIQPWIEVSGPVVLPPLHDFQRVIRDRIVEFLRDDTARRGLLKLPTGAGKTRVAVDSLVEAFRSRALHGLILWIADREELCEQAFQTWELIWRAQGISDARLRLSRLWGKTNDRVVDVGERPHVVVATYQTLVRRMPTMPWLSEPVCIVVDEAHGSITPAFTFILRQAGLTPRRTPRHLIGLSATPFRGRDEETKRLVDRYGGHRFDDDVFGDDDAHSCLRERGILSEVEHFLIQGADPRLTAEERAAFDLMPDLPTSVENRMASDSQRNLAIVSEIERRPADWPILVYAISVTHAQVLAAELARRGITAMAVTDKSRTDARRHAIAGFRSNQIRVLTNYRVLATGLDVPSVRSVFITRPVFSKSLYQQMIGRGLRGPANGGTERCEIVNINDNLEQYGKALAFSEFEYLWRGEV